MEGSQEEGETYAGIVGFEKSDFDALVGEVALALG